jgi:hypothetical protein
MVSAAGIGLSEFGYIVLAADAGNEEDARIVFENRDKYELVIFVGASALTFNYEGKYLFEIINAPKYYWLLDPIFYDLSRIQPVRLFLDNAFHSNKYQFLVPDQFSARLINSLIPESATYFPFAGFCSPINQVAEPKKAIAVFGTIGRELGGGLNSTLEDAIRSSEPVPLDVLFSLCQFDPDVFLSPPVVKWISNIDSFLKRSRRIEIVKALSEFQVEFYGSGWDSLIESNAKWVNHGEFSDPDMATEMQKYSVVLNFDPNWDDGIHDRVYTALVAGTRVITNRSSEIRNEWINSGDVLTYNAHTCEFDGDVGTFIQRPRMPTERIFEYQCAMSWSSRISKFLLRHTFQFRAG